MTEFKYGPEVRAYFRNRQREYRAKIKKKLAEALDASQATNAAANPQTPMTGAVHIEDKQAIA